MNNCYIFVDGHVHFHDFPNLEQLFETVYSNFYFRANLNNKFPFLPVLFLCNTEKENFFSSIVNDSKDKKTQFGKWHIERTSESCSFKIRSETGELFYIIIGEQLTTKENLEILSIGSSESLKNGLPLREIAVQIDSNNAIPIIPWGFGKWYGKRGAILTEFINEDHSSNLFLGDNGGRPSFLPYPGQLDRAKKRQIVILPGSDSLPVSGSYKKIGTFGFIIKSTISEETPFYDIKKLLNGTNIKIENYGTNIKTIHFLKNQIKLFLKKIVKQ